MRGVASLCIELLWRFMLPDAFNSFLFRILTSGDLGAATGKTEMAVIRNFRHEAIGAQSGTLAAIRHGLHQLKV